MTEELLEETLQETSQDNLVEPADFAEVLQGRAAFYETLASLFFDPLKQEQIDAMAEQDLSAYADINEDFAEGINDITRTLRKRNSGTRQTLAVDFTGAFVGTSTWKGRYCVPYKSVFTSERGLMYQEGYREVFDIFKSEAIKKRDGLDWPEDHISFLFQFMAMLSRRAAEAIQEGRKEDALHDLQLSLEFLQQHIASWYGELFDLSMNLLQTRFYRGVMKLTRGYITFDQEVLADLIEEVEAL